MKIESIIDSIEKILRYLIPSFIFLIGMQFVSNNNFDNFINSLNTTQWIVFFLLFGILYYSLHRLIFEYVDIIISKILKSDELLIFEKNIESKSSSYMYYKFALLHSNFILSEQLFIFSFFKKDYRCCLILLSIILFIITIIIYYKFFKIQNELLSKNNKVK